MTQAARKVKWDESVIAEHDKERGTRMKIDEPPTPYHAPTALRDELPFLALEASTASVPLLASPPFRNAKASPPAPPPPVPPPVRVSTFEEEEEEDEDEKEHGANEDHDLSPAEVLERMEEERRRHKFEAARKMHYDEAMRIKQLKQAGALREDDDDDDDE